MKKRKSGFVFSVLNVIMLLLTLSMIGFAAVRISMGLQTPNWLYYEMGGVFLMSSILKRLERRCSGPELKDGEEG